MVFPVTADIYGQISSHESQPTKSDITIDYFLYNLTKNVKTKKVPKFVLKMIIINKIKKVKKLHLEFLYIN